MGCMNCNKNYNLCMYTAQGLLVCTSQDQNSILERFTDASNPVKPPIVAPTASNPVKPAVVATTASNPVKPPVVAPTASNPVKPPVVAPTASNPVPIPSNMAIADNYRRMSPNELLKVEEYLLAHQAH